MEPMQLQQATGLQLVATNAPQLHTAHAQMIEWARAQVARCDAETRDEEHNLMIAEDRNWATAPFRRRVNLLARRRVFYEKIELALQAGYVIVPNFPMDVFAIRTEREAPAQRIARWQHSTDHTQKAQLLPPGDGEYRNPHPDVTAIDEGKWMAVDEWNEVEFPIALAKPLLMEHTAEALERLIFDEVGVADDRSGDPIIIGKIRNPRSGRPDISFFIGWYFDPSRL